jgi:hypothetical protein
MAFATDITLSDGAVNHVYSSVGGSLYDVTRRNATAALDQPELIRISHQVTGKALTTTNRSRVVISKTVEDAAGNQDEIKVSLIIQVPAKLTTAAAVLLVAKQIVAFSTDANIGKVINLES